MTVIMLDKKTWVCEHLEEGRLSAYHIVITPYVYTTKAVFTIMAQQAQNK